MTALRDRTVKIAASRLRYVALILLIPMFALCAVALSIVLGVLPLPYPLRLVQQRLPVLFQLHMASAGLAALAVPLAIACHGLSVHRLVGGMTTALVLAAGVSAVPVALMSEAHALARVGFIAQATAWMVLLLAGLNAIRDGDGPRHVRLMLAVAAVTSGALWLRLATWAAVRLEAPFVAAYSIAAWLSWLVPLGIVALLTAPARKMRKRKGDHTGASARRVQ
jgi:hypothetical protein